MNRNLINNDPNQKETKIKIGSSKSANLFFSNIPPNHFILESKDNNNYWIINFSHFNNHSSSFIPENYFNFDEPTIQKVIDTIDDPTFNFDPENLKLIDLFDFSFYKVNQKKYFTDTSLVSLIFNNLLFKEFYELENPDKSQQKFIWDFENWLAPISSSTDPKTFFKSLFISHFIFSNFLKKLNPEDQFSIFMPKSQREIDGMVVPPIELFSKTTLSKSPLSSIKFNDEPKPIYYSFLKRDDFEQQAFTHSFKNIYNTINLDDILKNINNFVKTNFDSHFFSKSNPNHTLNKTTQNFTKSLKDNLSFLEDIRTKKNNTSNNFLSQVKQFPELPNKKYFQQLLQKEYGIDFDIKINNLLPLLEPTLASKWFKNIINENLYSDLILKQVLSEMNIFLNEIETNPNSSNEISFYNWKLDLNFINKKLLESFNNPQLKADVQDLLTKMLIISLSFKLNNLSFKLPKKLNEIIDYQFSLEQEISFFNKWNFENFNTQMNLASSLNQKIFLTPSQQKEFEKDEILANTHLKLKKEVETLVQTQKQTKNILVSNEQLINSILTSKLFNLGHSLKDIIKTFSEIIDKQLPFLKSKIHFLNLSAQEIQTLNIKMTNFLTETKLNFKQNFETTLENLEFLFVYSLLARSKPTDDKLKERMEKIVNSGRISTGDDFKYFDFSLFKNIIQSLNDLKRQNRPTLIDIFSSLPKITIIDNGVPSQYFPLNSLPMAFLIPYLFNNCAGNRIYNAFQKIITDQPNLNIPEAFWYLGYDFANNKITTLTEISQKQNDKDDSMRYIVSEELTFFNKEYKEPACFKSIFNNRELNQSTTKQFEKSFLSSNEKEVFIVKINDKVHALGEKILSEFSKEFPDFLQQKKLNSKQLLFLTKKIEQQNELVNNPILLSPLNSKKQL